jgi:hypothetical protein
VRSGNSNEKTRLIGRVAEFFYGSGVLVLQNSNFFAIRANQYSFASLLWFLLVQLILYLSAAIILYKF